MFDGAEDAEHNDVGFVEISTIFAMRVDFFEKVKASLVPSSDSCIVYVFHH